MEYEDQVEEVLVIMCTLPYMTNQQVKEAVEAMLEVSALTREGLHADIVEGVGMGYSVHEQMKEAKQLIKELGGPLDWIKIKAENDLAEEE